MHLTTIKREQSKDFHISYINDNNQETHESPGKGQDWPLAAN